jgi:hypothetical protein
MKHWVVWQIAMWQDKTRGVSHCGLAIYIKKYLKAKEEWWKFKYFTMQKHDLQKNPLKETKILQDTILYIKAKMVSVQLSVCLSDDGSAF